MSWLRERGTPGAWTRFGNARWGGEVVRVGDVLGAERWQWRLWTGFPAGNSGTAPSEADAIEALRHALAPDDE